MPNTDYSRHFAKGSQTFERAIKWSLSWLDQIIAYQKILVRTRLFRKLREVFINWLNCWCTRVITICVSAHADVAFSRKLLRTIYFKITEVFLYYLADLARQTRQSPLRKWFLSSAEAPLVIGSPRKFSSLRSPSTLCLPLWRPNSIFSAQSSTSSWPQIAFALNNEKN